MDVSFSQSAEDLHSSCDSLSSVEVGSSNAKSDVYTLSATITNTGVRSASHVSLPFGNCEEMSVQTRRLLVLQVFVANTAKRTPYT